MKNSKIRRALMLLACAVLLVCLSVGATLAYLTSSDAVQNTFTVGKVAIQLDEYDTDGSQTNPTVSDRDRANEYHLMPGHEYYKDPTIMIIPGSEDCFVFVKVENGIDGIEADGNTTIAAQMAANGWVNLSENIYYYGTAEAATAVPAETGLIVFETFTIDPGVDEEKLAEYEEAEINITAYAIQADGFDPAEVGIIWSAFATQEFN